MSTMYDSAKAEIAKLEAELEGYKHVTAHCWDLAKDFVAARKDTDPSIAVDLDFLVGRMLREITVEEAENAQLRKLCQDFDTLMAERGAEIVGLRQENERLAKETHELIDFKDELQKDLATAYARITRMDAALERIVGACLKPLWTSREIEEIAREARSL